MKRKVVKRICSMLLVSVMVAGCLAGCGKTEMMENSESNSTESKENTAKGTEETETKKLNLDGPVTLTILAVDTEAQKPEDVYIYKYLEWYLAEQGYDVTLDVTHVSSSEEWEQQISIAFGTGELPDMGWGYSLSESNQVVYGQTDKLLLDWTPYFNEETMPNLMERFEEVPDALTASTCGDGGVYTLPAFYDVTVGSTRGSATNNNVLYYNQAWLDQIGWDTYPSTVDEFLDMARAMKNFEHPEGIETWPLSDYGAMLANVLVWLPNGYSGGSSKYGTSFLIKNGEIVLGCYEEEYRELVTLYNQMYEEGLLHPDFLTLDNATNNAMISAGQYGVMGSTAAGQPVDKSSTNPYGEDEQFRNSIFVGPLTNDTGIKPVANITQSYGTGRVWASSETKYPELCALMVDCLYSAEGGLLYQYGPQEGKDPLNVQAGWNFDGSRMTYADQGDLSTAEYVYNRMNGFSDLFNQRGLNQCAYDIAGIEHTNPDWELKDGLTGKTFVVQDFQNGPALTAWKEHFYLNENCKWAKSGNATIVNVPGAYLSEEDSLRAANLATVIKEYVNSETAKFMIGERSLEEVDKFWEELKSMGIEEYIEIYREAYALFLEATL